MEALKRRSCRTFKETPIEKEKLEQILEAGRYAPTGMDKQELHFHVITDKALLEDMVKKTQKGLETSEMFKNFAKTPIIYNGPAVICMTCKQEDKAYAAYDCGFACQNMMIKAETLGIGTVPIAIMQGAPGVWVEALKVPEEELLMAVVFGYPTEDFKPKEKVLKNKAMLNDLVKKTQEHFKNTPENAAMANNAITFGGPAVICMTCNKELVKWAPYDCGFACQNMLITAESLGIATLPLGIIKRATNVWLEALKVPEEELLMAVVFGYPTEDFKPKEKVLKSKVIYH
ncbi:Nitroreductase family protein [Entamoeba marina]